MSKFHDEFFRQGSPVHDALMIKCLSKDGIRKITSALGDVEIISPKKLIGVVCTTPNILVFNEIKKCDLFDEGGNCLKGFSCPSSKECEYKVIRQTRSLFEFDTTKYKPIKAEEITVLATVDIDEPLIKKETEVIIRNGTFIIGYADAVISEEWKVKVKYIVNDGWVVKKTEFSEYRKIIVEAKPEITSIGEVIRQLKTYASLIGNKDTHMVIATYSKLGEDALEYLANENIIVVQFDRS